MCGPVIQCLSPDKIISLRSKCKFLLNSSGLEPSTSSTAGLTITIRDVNDEPPRFNQAEYKVSIPENVPYGTPLANLNMEIKDTDTGINSIFTIHLEDPSEKFSIDPVRATGHTAVSLKINKVRPILLISQLTTHIFHFFFQLIPFILPGTPLPCGA